MAKWCMFCDCLEIENGHVCVNIIINTNYRKDQKIAYTKQV